MVLKFARSVHNNIPEIFAGVYGFQSLRLRWEYNNNVEKIVIHLIYFLVMTILVFVTALKIIAH